MACKPCGARRRIEDIQKEYGQPKENDVVDNTILGKVVKHIKLFTKSIGLLVLFVTVLIPTLIFILYKYIFTDNRVIDVYKPLKKMLARRKAKREQLNGK